MKPEDRKRLKQHIEMIVEHKEPDEIVRENFKKLQDEVADLREKNIKLRLELSTLRFKESQEQRFIWWVREVFAKNVQDTVAGIIHACTYQDEPTAAAGKYGLPIKCFEMMRRLTESTHGIYAHTDIVDEMSVGVKNTNPDYDNQDYDNRTKTSSDNNKLDIHTLEYAAKWIENSLVGETNERVIEFGKNMAMSIRAAKPSISDVSVTPDVLMDIETDQSIENEE